MPLPSRAWRLAIAAALAIVALVLPRVRRQMIADIVTWDAPPSEAPALPAEDGSGGGLPPSDRTRVLLVDGLSADTAATLPAWTALCQTGVTMTIDTGFPTVSLPVEVALWSGLTQQQTGVVFHSERPLDPPLGARGIPAQVASSVAIAESHGYIVRSLGFAHSEPAADPQDPARDVDDDAWRDRWLARASDAVASDAKLVFVHVLRVDTAGHHFGHDAPEYRASALEADGLVGKLHAIAPDARWFLLSDHGHLAAGGHGGEERKVRQVQGCIVGPGVQPARGELVHIVDVARALADSTGTRLDRASHSRPLARAIAEPLRPDQALPRLAISRALIAVVLLAIGGVLTTLALRQWWLAPWWFVISLVALFVIRGQPTLSTPMIYGPTGRDMYVVWLPAVALAGVSTWFAARRLPLSTIVLAQLALPLAAVAAAFTVTGAWPALVGGAVAPIVPRYTAWLSPLLLLTAHGAAAVALGVLATLVPRASDRPAPPAPPRTPDAAA